MAITCLYVTYLTEKDPKIVALGLPNAMVLKNCQYGHSSHIRLGMQYGWEGVLSKGIKATFSK